MTDKNKYHLLIWIAVILAATNISMGLSFWYHRQQDSIRESQKNEQYFDVPAQQRTRYFREKLDLDPQQIIRFRELNRRFNQTASSIQYQLAELRLEMVHELGMTSPDMQRLDSISSRIGELHKLLKDETIRYYIEMKIVSDEEQQEKLHEIFLSVLKNNDNLKLQRGGGRFKNIRK